MKATEPAVVGKEPEQRSLVPLQTDLILLSRDINAAHQACRESVNAYVEHALVAGQLLLKAKAAIPHGGWLRWVEQHCTFSLRTAQLYMQLAFHSQAPGVPNAQRAAHLGESIRKAMEKLVPRQCILRPTSKRGWLEPPPPTLWDFMWSKHYKPLPPAMQPTHEEHQRACDRMGELDAEIRALERKYVAEQWELRREYYRLQTWLYMTRFGGI